MIAVAPVEVAELAERHDGLTDQLGAIDYGIAAVAARLSVCGAISDGGRWLRRRGAERSTLGADGWDSEDSYLADVTEWRRLTGDRAGLRRELAAVAEALDAAIAEPAPDVPAVAPAPLIVPAPVRRPRIRPMPRRRPAVRPRVVGAPPAWSWPAAAPVGTSRRSLGDWYALSPAAGPNRGRGALAAVTGAMLAAVLWLAAGAVVAWGLGVGPMAATGIAAAAAMLTLAVTNVSHGRIAARLDAQSPA